MTDKEQGIIKFQATIDLPTWRPSDWYRYIESFINMVPADEIGLLMNIKYPQLIAAIAQFQSKGMNTERIAGILTGMALMQMLGNQDYLKISEAPLRIKPEGM